MCAFVCDRLKETTDVPKHVVDWWSKSLRYSRCRSIEFLCTYWQWYAIVTSSLHTVQACSASFEIGFISITRYWWPAWWAVALLVAWLCYLLNLLCCNCVFCLLCWNKYTTTLERSLGGLIHTQQPVKSYDIAIWNAAIYRLANWATIWTLLKIVIVQEVLFKL